MPRQLDSNAALLIYCTAADGERYGMVGATAGLTRDEFVWTFLNAAEADGDTVNEIYLVTGYYAPEELQQAAETKPPKNSMLAYSQQWPYSNRGHRPDPSKCLRIDAL